MPRHRRPVALAIHVRRLSWVKRAGQFAGVVCAVPRLSGALLVLGWVVGSVVGEVAGAGGRLSLVGCDRPLVAVDDGVVAAAEADEVVDVSASTVGPVGDVVGFGPV